MDLVFIIGLTAVSLKVVGRKIRSQGLEHIVGKMDGDMKDIGIKIICMAKVNTIGQMVDHTRALM